MIAIVAILSIRALVVTIEKPPLRLEILPEPPRPASIVATLPAPQLHKPDIHVPDPPRFEVIQVVEVVEVVESAAPPPAAPPRAVVAVAAPEAIATIAPPRFDLAYLDNPAPAYPVFAKRAREQGKVLLRVRVDAAALAAVKRWRFAPARQGGRAIAGVAIVPIDFQLES